MKKEEYFNKFSKKLIEVFGKDTFTEEELTKEFYTELYISCSDFFTTDEGSTDLDFFWSDSVKNWLISSKK